MLTLSNLKQEVVYQKGNPNLYYHSELAEHTSNSRALIPAVNMGTTDNIKLCKDCDALYLLPSNSYSVYSGAKFRFLTTMHHFYCLFPSINLTDGLNWTDFFKWGVTSHALGEERENKKKEESARGGRYGRGSVHRALAFSLSPASAHCIFPSPQSSLSPISQEASAEEREA